MLYSQGSTIDNLITNCTCKICNQKLEYRKRKNTNTIVHYFCKCRESFVYLVEETDKYDSSLCLYLTNKIQLSIDFDSWSLSVFNSVLLGENDTLLLDLNDVGLKEEAAIQEVISFAENYVFTSAFK